LNDKKINQDKGAGVEKSKNNRSTQLKSSHANSESPSKKKSPKKQPMIEREKSIEQESKPTVKEVTQKEKITAEEKLKKVGDRLSVAADKGVDLLKEVFGKVKDFSVDAAELTRLKVEIYHLKNERERLLTVMGEKLWQIRDSYKLKAIEPLFTEDFKKLKEFDTAIQTKEKNSSKISL
jgi:hypothetical protein